MSKEYGIPALHIRVSRKGGSGCNPLCLWSVTMTDKDCRGERKLGYLSRIGVIKGDLTGLQIEKGPEFHDEELPRWTSMNATDRPDIRKKIIQLVRTGTTKLMPSDQPEFEHFNL